MLSVDEKSQIQALDLTRPGLPMKKGRAGTSPASPLRLSLNDDLDIVAQRGRGLFAKLIRRRLKCGVLRSIADLQAAIDRFIEEVNGDPKPFVWTADPDTIIAAVKRAPSVRVGPLATLPSRRPTHTSPTVA